MQRKSTAGSAMLRKCSKPADKFWVADKIQAFRCQHRHMQRLAYMASRIRPIRVAMEKTAARGKVQNRRARQHRQRPAPLDLLKFGWPQVHKLTLNRTTLDAPTRVFVAKKITRFLAYRLLDPAPNPAYARCVAFNVGDLKAASDFFSVPLPVCSGGPVPLVGGLEFRPVQHAHVPHLFCRRFHGDRSVAGHRHYPLG